MNIAAEITSIDAQIAAKNATITELIPAEAEWRAQSNVGCSGLPAKKQACEQDKVWKRSKADALLNQISGLRTEIAELTTTKESLLAQQRAQNQAQITLAGQGLSLSALDIQATGAAAAAQAKADAEAAAILRGADSKTDTEKTKQMVLVIAAAVVALILVAIAVKFLKNKKTSK